ncbi:MULTISPECIES: hypothetical protein [Bacillus]|nr:hypothetical protein [Bacillus altitudinis]MEC1143352.1 hypothetical protein [Bacillus altitudinis]
MKENTWIEGWFEKCEELEIKPWEWDFKQSVSGLNKRIDLSK